MGHRSRLVHFVRTEKHKLLGEAAARSFDLDGCLAEAAYLLVARVAVQAPIASLAAGHMGWLEEDSPLLAEELLGPAAARNDAAHMGSFEEEGDCSSCWVGNLILAAVAGKEGLVGVGFEVAAGRSVEVGTTDSDSGAVGDRTAGTGQTAEHIEHLEDSHFAVAAAAAAHSSFLAARIRLEDDHTTYCVPEEDSLLDNN